jgi:hypothetical protein
MAGSGGLLSVSKKFLAILRLRLRPTWKSSIHFQFHGI